MLAGVAALCSWGTVEATQPVCLPIPIALASPTPIRPQQPDLLSVITTDLKILNRCLSFSANSRMHTRVEDNSTRLEIPAAAVDQFLLALQRELPPPGATPLGPPTSSQTISFSDLHFKLTATIQSQDLDVHIVGSPDKDLLPGTPTTWNWRVRPGAQGNYSLTATIRIHITTRDGQSFDRDLDPRSASVAVQGDIIDPLSQLARWLTTYPGILLPLAIIALIGSITVAIIGARSKRTQTGDSQQPKVTRAGSNKTKNSKRPTD